MQNIYSVQGWQYNIFGEKDLSSEAALFIT